MNCSGFPGKSYAGIHMHLRRKHGPASFQACRCGDSAAEWAYDGSDPDPSVYVNVYGSTLLYSRDCSRYTPLCRTCHKVEDGHRGMYCQAGLHRMEGHNVMVSAGKRRCRECVYIRNRTANHALSVARHTDPRAAARHERKMAAQRERRLKARQS